MSTLATQEKVPIWVREPVVFINGIVVIMEAAIPALVMFELINWTPDQVASAMGVVVTVGTVFKTWLERRLVTPVADPKNDNGRKLVAIQ